MKCDIKLTVTGKCIADGHPRLNSVHTHAISEFGFSSVVQFLRVNVNNTTRFLTVGSTCDMRNFKADGRALRINGLVDQLHCTGPGPRAAGHLVGLEVSSAVLTEGAVIIQPRDQSPFERPSPFTGNAVDPDGPIYKSKCTTFVLRCTYKVIVVYIMRTTGGRNITKEAV